MNEPDTAAVEHRLEPLTDLSDSRVWNMLESAPDGMLLADEQGAILIVNRQVEVLFGYDRGELLGRPVETLIPQRHHDVHRTQRESYQAAPAVRAMGVAFDLLGRRKDGSEFPVEISLSPISDHAGAATVASIRDVTDRLHAERRLELSERAFRTAFESAPAGMATIHVDAQGGRTVERVNRSFCEILLYEPDDLIGADLADVTHPDDEAADAAAAAAMAGGQRDAYSREKRYRRSDGSYVWVLMHSALLGGDASALVLCHIVDLTERRAMQAERARVVLLEDRERIGRDLHDLVIQRLFAAGMGLQSVIPHASPPDAVDRVQATIDELDATIRELRSTIFGLNSGGGSESVAARLQNTLAAHRTSLGFAPSLVAEGDLERIPPVVLEQILPSLNEALSNVAKHAASTAVTVTADVGEHRVVLVIHDNGIGIGIGAAVVRGHGLGNLESRAERVGGSSAIAAAPQGGTSVTWTAPI